MRRRDLPVYPKVFSRGNTINKREFRNAKKQNRNRRTIVNYLANRTFRFTRREREPKKYILEHGQIIFFFFS